MRYVREAFLSWTARDDERLKDLIRNGKKISEAASILGRTIGATQNRMRTLKLTTRPHVRWTQAEDLRIAELLQAIGFEALTQKKSLSSQDETLFKNRTKGAIRTRIYTLGLTDFVPPKLKVPCPFTNDELEQLAFVEKMTFSQIAARASEILKIEVSEYIVGSWFARKRIKNPRARSPKPAGTIRFYVLAHPADMDAIKQFAEFLAYKRLGEENE